jgi:hypothetical protein
MWPFPKKKYQNGEDAVTLAFKKDHILLDLDNRPGWHLVGIKKSDIQEMIAEELAKSKDST